MTSVNTESRNLTKRDPSQVVKLARMGSMHQTRLSFMRVLLRRLSSEQWKVQRQNWQVDANGIGHAVYTAQGPQRTYSLLVFANDLDPAKRSDRVIAEEWDATFTLVDGIPTAADIERLKDNVPKQEVGRISANELCLSRANRSVRLFDYVRKQLAQGLQPELAALQKVGYLMRTTAVYGSGKFGALDRQFLHDRTEFTEPFQCELLAVYMIRLFSVDIVEHLAQTDAPDSAVKLDIDLRRTLGIGNSTGLGMAPFIVNHPVLFNQWIGAREEALLRVRSVEVTDNKRLAVFESLLARQRHGVKQWHSEHPLQIEKIHALDNDLEALSNKIDQLNLLGQSQPWNALYLWSEQHLSLEGQECVVTLLIEIYPELVDELATSMSIDEAASFTIDGLCKVHKLRQLLQTHYQFALDIDFSNNATDARFWYASEEKLEPRLGERYSEEGADQEHPLAVARDVSRMNEDLSGFSETATIAEFLLQYPQHRHVVRRVQQVKDFPYAEITDNLTAHDMLPIDMLRCKLSFFGAVKFDPRSDRWVRINMFQNAPLPDELLNSYDDTWVYPGVDTHTDSVV